MRVNIFLSKSTITQKWKLIKQNLWFKLRTNFDQWTKGVLIFIHLECRTNCTSEQFEEFCKKLDIPHEKSSPYYHQSNSAAKKSVDKIKWIHRKEKKKSVQELSFNYIARAGDKSGPMEMFLGCQVWDVLGNHLSREWGHKTRCEGAILNFYKPRKIQ